MIPSTAKITPTSFKVSIPQADLVELKKLLKLSKLAPETYENVQNDRRFGVTGEWMKQATAHWEHGFSW